MFTQTQTLADFLKANGGKLQLKKNKSTGKTFVAIGELTAMLSKKVDTVNAENFRELSVSHFESEDGEVRGWMVHPTGGAETIAEFSLDEIPEFKVG